MGRKNKYTKEIKLKAILDYEKGIKSIIQLCDELDCSHMSIRAWIRGYRAQGDDFFNNKTNRSSTEITSKIKRLNPDGISKSSLSCLIIFITVYLTNISSMLKLESFHIFSFHV